jgi:adenylyltransferase/sulfurtransferase
MKEINVNDLKAKMDAGEDFFLLDVREPHEYQISNIDGVLIPLGEIPDRYTEIEDQRDKEVVVMCRSGGRSAQAAKFLESKGFKDVYNLQGGVNAWARFIDPSLPIY